MPTTETAEKTPSPGRGRPPKVVLNRPIDKAAEALADRHRLPEPPAKQLRFEQMQEYFALLTPEMWSHLMVYIYRIKPRIIRQLKDPSLPNYIDCLSEPFTIDYMIQRHGGGKYMLEIIDTAKTKRGPGTEANHLFRSYLEVDEVRHEPKLNYEELDINHRDNMSYLALLQHRGILDNKGSVVNNQQAPVNTGLNTEVIKEILGFVSKLNTDQQAALRAKLTTDEDALSKSVGQILLEKMKQDDPSKQVQMLSGLLTALKEIVGTTKNTDASGLYDRIITMQSEHNKTVLQLIERITENREKGGDRDDFDRLEKVLNFAHRLSDLRGGGGRRSPWDIGLDYAKELVVPGLQTLNNFMATRRNGPVGQMPGPTAPVAPQAFDPYANPQALRSHAATLASQQPGPSAAPPAPQAGSLQGLLMQYSTLVISALNNGTAGYDFADYLVGLFGNATFAMIAAQGEEMLVQTMMSIPEISIFGEARVRTFVNQFIHYEEFLSEGEDEEPEEPEPVTAKTNSQPKTPARRSQSPHQSQRQTTAP